jgi:alkanesulfonate monooxygenase SsuD/methylene tetrahydromethanopterin reductase-like flavin-dependent oxidoreductase (luciferase family)
MLETAKALDRGGFDTIWLPGPTRGGANGMEARSSTVLSALMARDASG